MNEQATGWCFECAELHDPRVGWQQGDATFCCHCDCHSFDFELSAMLDNDDQGEAK